MDWPHVSVNPINEFGGRRIFAAAFPWLFPGGIGDIMDYDGDMGAWGKMMLFYEDGRFAKDKMFCFYAMNYITRHRNASSGNYFIDTFKFDCPETLDELKQDIKNGHTSFVNSLTYYNRRIKGSSPYWKQKRGEAYAWINYHVKEGNGLPTFFITLSCAEYYWKDIVQLLRERMLMAGEDVTECYVGSPKLVAIANDYSIVIQEYFQKRVETWLETVGKVVFDISHYWCRFEFAPGRGQIHAHMLAIKNDQSPFQHAYDISKADPANGNENKAAFLAKWARETIGLTASVDDGYDNRVIDEKNSPLKVGFVDVCSSAHSVKEDGQDLLRAVQHHECSAFCLKQHEKR